MRIVVADNDPAVLDLLTVDLGLEGHEVVAVVADGSAAVEHCRTDPPDVLVVDYRMPPGPNGLEVARLVADVAPNVRVIIFSNYEDTRVIKAARKAGAQFVAKGDLRHLRRVLDGA